MAVINILLICLVFWYFCRRLKFLEEKIDKLSDDPVFELTIPSRHPTYPYQNEAERQAILKELNAPIGNRTFYDPENRTIDGVPEKQVMMGKYGTDGDTQNE